MVCRRLRTNVAEIAAALIRRRHDRVHSVVPANTQIIEVLYFALSVV